MAIPRESRVSEAQLAALKWLVAEGEGRPTDNATKISIRALETRGLAKVRRIAGIWTATPTDGGRHFAEHGGYLAAGEPKPDEGSEPAAPSPKRAAQTRTSKKREEPIADFVVDSPAGHRARGGQPEGDALFRGGEPDPWDSLVLITVKEAAWMLSLPQQAIYRAVWQGELDRVFIGKGTTNYRIVYGSLLAWVNAMPRESSYRPWYQPW